MDGASIWNSYCGPAPVPGDWLSRWNADPVLLAALAVSAIAWQMAIGRRESFRQKWFAGGFVLLLLLFISPFCALTSALFSARVVHHAVLTAIAAPLLALALPDNWRLPGSAAIWAVVHALIFWAWHWPAAYSAALSNDALYWAMQLSMLGSAIALWLAILSASPPSAVASLLGTMVQMGLLGALIAFASAPLYPPHLATTLAWNLNPLEDQQLAGLVMWVPAAGLYLAAALTIAGRWLRSESPTAVR